MTEDNNLLATAEAAYVCCGSVEDASKIIEVIRLLEDLHSPRDDGAVPAGICGLVAFFLDEHVALGREVRLSVARAIAPRILHSRGPESAAANEDWTIRQGDLVVDLSPYVKDVAERLRRLIAARELVVSSPEILSGTPVIRGTRIPALDIAASVKAGISIPDIVDDYPGIDAEMVELAVIFADTHLADVESHSGNPRARRPAGRNVRRVPRHGTEG